VIDGNEISHYYYGLFSSYSNPKIDNNVILPFIGNGIFLWHSNPQITNTRIIAYIGTGISCYFSSPLIVDSEINAGSNDFYLSSDSHPTVSNTIFNTSMVHIDDASSSLLVGAFEKKSNRSEVDQQFRSDETYQFGKIIGILTFSLLSIIFIILMKSIYLKPRIKEKSFDRNINKKRKRMKIRPKNSWKRK
jgi:hypothetical protein